jgi:hypothetical protein
MEGSAEIDIVGDADGTQDGVLVGSSVLIGREVGDGLAVVGGAAGCWDRPVGLEVGSIFALGAPILEGAREGD